ncbi:MAG: glycoside hydrolase family 2 [Phycisphaerae bacterium]|nr:glycoside hydrolase family 2 [Gemmatimonadaceae bacterium]
MTSGPEELSEVYPRPQLQRDDWTSLDGHWDFVFDDARQFRHPDEIESWPLQILVPFPPESTASGIGDRGFHRSCWYRREFRCAPHDGRVLLHFGAVDYSCKVWVNGHHVATHEGGHTPFIADITSALEDGEVQVVALRADDDPHELTKPRGKQDWQLESHSIWYPRTTGIWQTVWFERVSHTYVEKLRWTPHLDGLAITIEARIAGELTGELQIEILLQHGDRLLARDRYSIIDREVDRRIILSDPGIDDFRNELLWSPERPTLFDARVCLLQNGVIIDEVQSYTALRSVDISRDRFMLNGRPYALRMVLDQGYWPDTLLAAPNDEALRRDVELAKAMGFNGVRKHQKIENPRYLYWADKLGLLVWEEMPSAYRFTRTAIKRMVSEWTATIDRDYSHPCVIVWVPFNESWGVPDLPSITAHRHAVAALYHLTKTLDPTRPVIGNDGWESSATDIIGIHDYEGNPERLHHRYAEFNTEQLFDRRRPGGRILTLDGYPHRGQPIMLTEFGGVSLEAGGTGEHTKAWGYTNATDAEQFAARYKALLRAVSDTALFSGFCYTQFADTFQETNGLLTADRVPKFPIEAIAEATRALPT